MPIHLRARAVHLALAIPVLSLSSNAAAQLQAGSVCESLEVRVSGANNGTESACVNERSFTDPEDPSRHGSGFTLAESHAEPGVWRVRARASSDSLGVADALGHVTTDSSFSVQSTDPARQGEQVFVTLGAHRVDFGTERSTVEPPESEFGGASVASTRLTYEFSMFTLTSGSQLDWRWSDEALNYDEAGSINDTANHEVVGELKSYVVPMLLGEGASFRLSLSAFAHAHGTANALVDAWQSVYWGGITSVVDAAGKPVDYYVPVHDGMDWSTSYVPGVAAPVPEPVAALMLGLGVTGVSLARRRRGTTRGRAGRA